MAMIPAFTFVLVFIVLSFLTCSNAVLVPEADVNETAVPVASQIIDR